MKKYVVFVLFLGIGFSTCKEAFSQVADTATNNSELFNEGGYVRGITTARAIGLVELGLGLASLVIAIRAKKRSAKKGAKTAMILGLIAVAFCIAHLITTAGAIFGSGSGKAGSIIAMILSLIGIAFASRTLCSGKK